MCDKPDGDGERLNLRQHRLELTELDGDVVVHDCNGMALARDFPFYQLRVGRVAEVLLRQIKADKLELANDPLKIPEADELMGRHFAGLVRWAIPGDVLVDRVEAHCPIAGELCDQVGLFRTSVADGDVRLAQQ